uniref:Hyaluronan/mRNA-binding protein domain-containing protein n=1 Tax=Mycena chlorophos TaxID=658473 RepID=A0ABQ0LWD2_MYCCL|nr:predicted protein [Mycena chlorophos]
MTRTARSASLRSMLKDRSENKTGVSGALRKNGGGAHNWGSLENERDLEFAGMDDGAAELEEDRASDDNNDTESLTDDASSSGSDEVALKKPTLSPTTTSDDIARRHGRLAAQGVRSPPPSSATPRTNEERSPLHTPIQSTPKPHSIPLTSHIFPHPLSQTQSILCTLCRRRRSRSCPSCTLPSVPSNRNPHCTILSKFSAHSTITVARPACFSSSSAAQQGERSRHTPNHGTFSTPKAALTPSADHIPSSHDPCPNQSRPSGERRSNSLTLAGVRDAGSCGVRIELEFSVAEARFC